MWRATVLTIFPEMFPGPLGASLAGKASGRLWSLEAVDIRDYATDKHRSVDDTPAGGGPGMVMRADVIARAIDAVAADDAPAPADEPARPPVDPGAGPRARRRAGDRHPVRPVRGDRRARDRRPRPRRSVDRRLCALGRRDRRHGDDRCLRAADPRGDGQGSLRLPRRASADGLLEYPQFTRPQLWEGRAIPEVLLSGDHGKVRAWRRDEARRSPASAGPTSGRLTRPDVRPSPKQVQGRSDSRNKGSTEG